MVTEHPRDVDPSITGQPHQVTGKVPDLMGKLSRTLGNPVNMPAAVRILVPPHPCSGPVTLPLEDPPQRATEPRDSRGLPVEQPRYAAPRCSASHTAVDSLTPSSTALPQWAIQAATPSGVPDTYASRAPT